MVLASSNFFYYDVIPQQIWVNERVGDHDDGSKDDIHVIFIGGKHYIVKIINLDTHEPCVFFNNTVLQLLLSGRILRQNPYKNMKNKATYREKENIQGSKQLYPNKQHI